MILGSVRCPSTRISCTDGQFQGLEGRGYLLAGRGYSLPNRSGEKLDWIAHIVPVHFQTGSQIAAKPSVFLYSPFLVPDVWSQMQPLPPNAVQVDKTVAEPESLKKLLIIWLMCIRLWECEINHQQWDELLKWILVFCLLSLGNGFSFLHHQVNRCRAAVFSFSQSQ